ncbi:MAG: hypothetical protein Q9205_006214 [Flavoplaca limonia]
MSTLRLTSSACRPLRSRQILSQIRYETTKTSALTSQSSGASSALVGGLAGGALAFAGGFAWYHFSVTPGTRSLVNTAHETKSNLTKYTQQFKESKPEPAEAIKWLRSIARSYAAFIPGARGHVDAFFDDLDAIHRKHGKEVDIIVTEAYSELKVIVASEGMSVSAAKKAWVILQKFMKRIGHLAGDAGEDILNNHPSLKEKVGGNINQLKQMGENYGPEAKKQIEETWNQAGDIIKGGVSASTIPQIQSLVQNKTRKVRQLGNKLWDQGMEKAKPYLDKSPEVKKLIEENKEQLKQGNAMELAEKIKESVQSDSTDELKQYVQSTVNKTKKSTAKGNGNGDLE